MTEVPSTVRFISGRKPPHPEETHPRMKASAVLTAGYQGVVPATVDWYTGIAFPMYMNDQIGDCTCADVGHGQQVFSFFGQGAVVTPTDHDVLTAYEKITGYDPSQTDENGDNPTDGGAAVQDVLGYWRGTGIGGHKIAAFFQVDHTNLDELRACCWLLGGVTLGVNFPASAMTQFNSGQPWDYDPHARNKIEGGHDVRLVGYDGAWWYVVTWGTVQKVTTAWLQHFCDEGWSEADLQWIKNNTSPEGLTAQALNTAYQQVTGRPGPFPVSIGPVPTPSPVPVPPSPQPAPIPDSDPDRILVDAVRDWANARHVGTNGKAARAVLQWMKDKGLK